MQFSGGLLFAQSQRANVGNTIALRVGVAASWRIDQISSQAVRRNQPWTFAQQDESELRAEQLSNMILQSNACAANKANRGDAPTVGFEQSQQFAHEGRSVRFHSQWREAFADNQRQFGLRNTRFAERLDRLGRKPPSQVRPQ